jgi:hypothetical protein
VDYLHEAYVVVKKPPWEHGRLLFTSVLLPEFVLANLLAQKLKGGCSIDTDSNGPNDHKRGLQSNQGVQMVDRRSWQPPPYFLRADNRLLPTSTF